MCNRPTAHLCDWQAASRFCVVVEKDIHEPGFMTHALMHALLAGCVPVYYGSMQASRKPNDPLNYTQLIP
eukprot:2559121-Pyramimonas_sp.AAC.1